MWRFRSVVQIHLRFVYTKNVKMTSKKAAINEKPKGKFGGFRRSESVMPPGIHIRKPSSAVISSGATAPSNAATPHSDTIPSSFSRPSSSNELDSSVKEGAKVFRRSSMICSEGFDKYTYDCHKQNISNRPTQPQSGSDVVMSRKNSTENSIGEQKLTNRDPTEINLAHRNLVENNLIERNLVERGLSERRDIAERKLIEMNMTDRNLNERSFVGRNGADVNLHERNLNERNPAEMSLSNKNLAERNMSDRRNLAERSKVENNLSNKSFSERKLIERNMVERNLIDRNMAGKRSLAERSPVEMNSSNRALAEKNLLDRNMAERNLMDRNLVDRRSLSERNPVEINLSNRALAERNLMDRNMADRKFGERSPIQTNISNINFNERNLAGRSVAESRSIAERNPVEMNLSNRNIAERRSLAERSPPYMNLSNRNLVERRSLAEISPVEMTMSNRNLMERSIAQKRNLAERNPIEMDASNKNFVERNWIERRSSAERYPVEMNMSNRNLVERSVMNRRSLAESNPVEINLPNRNLVGRNLVGKDVSKRIGFIEMNTADRSLAERNLVRKDINERNSVQTNVANENLPVRPERNKLERNSLAEKNAAQRSFVEMNKSNRSLAEMNMINRSLDEGSMNNKSLSEMNMVNRLLPERRSLAERSLAERNMADRRSLAERNIADRRSSAERNVAGKGLCDSSMVERNLMGNTGVLKDPLITSSTKQTSFFKKKTVSIKSPLVKRDSVVHPGRIDMQPSLCIGGRYQNPWPTWRPPSFTNILKFGLSKDKSKVPPKQELDLVLPIVKQNFSKLQIPDDGIRVTWIGHSTVLVQMHGLNVLTDPIFSDRASPSQVVGPKRFRDPPCSIHDLPHINAVVISHSHYDHLDLNTIILLNARFGADIRWFVPLGLQSWMQQVGCENVVELDWWEENCVPEHSDTFFVFTPAQHWSKRTIADDNKTLWGSWCILGPKYRFFFAGDTGYCDVFKQIGRVHGPFDLSAIPIGAYEPRWFMKYQHINPEEAVQIHLDVRSKRSLAVHWGTFCLANEYYLDPPRKLRDSLDKQEIPPEFFFTLKHGESRLIAQNNLVKRDNSQVINNYRK